MNARTIALTLALCFVGVAAAVATADPDLGTWKLNAAGSKIAPGVPRNDTVVYEAVGDNVKITVDGTDGAGKPTHNEWTGKFDGKNYPVTGDPTADARSVHTCRRPDVDVRQQPGRQSDHDRSHCRLQLTARPARSP